MQEQISLEAQITTLKEEITRRAARNRFLTGLLAVAWLESVAAFSMLVLAR